jgi:hypothetical protein
MGMATRSQFTFTGMLSLDRATVGRAGYRELFQAGETLNDRPLVDHQHPHDFFMQLSAAWRVPFGEQSSLTLVAAPVGEPTLGPPVFMHRRSTADLVLAPLGHHVFDSSHIAFGVAAASFERGRWTLEGAAFNGREPDENRWDFDWGALDSVAGRVWFRPRDDWELQASTARLVEPEAFEPGNIQRTTVSASWLHAGTDLDRTRAVTVAYGVNAGSVDRHAALAELAFGVGRQSWSGRLEVLQVDAHEGANDLAVEKRDDRNLVAALTIGVSRDVVSWRGWEGALGLAAGIVAAPRELRSLYGRLPTSVQVYLRIRPPAPAGRMWNMRMMRPMPATAGHVHH